MTGRITMHWYTFLPCPCAHFRKRTIKIDFIESFSHSFCILILNRNGIVLYCVRNTNIQWVGGALAGAIKRLSRLGILFLYRGRARDWDTRDRPWMMGLDCMHMGWAAGRLETVTESDCVSGRPKASFPAGQPGRTKYGVCVIGGRARRRVRDQNI